jgi:hypothetical protein
MRTLKRPLAPEPIVTLPPRRDPIAFAAALEVLG